MIYVLHSRPNGWADRDETWHTHSRPLTECFWQGQCQVIHVCLREWQKYETPAMRHLANDYETPSNYSSTNKARRRKRQAASAAGRSRTPSRGRVLTASST